MTPTPRAAPPARGRGRSGQRHAGAAPARGRADLSRLASAAAARGLVVIPTITFPEDLPVSARRADIAAAIRDHQVVIVSGETGSGKTTQIPKIALELGRGRAGQIGHTQPRRIAARSVAERIAEELGTTLGDIVGYQVRFTQQASERTLVKVMTDGILLAQIQHDPELRAYDTLIIDEAHERSLNIDFLLGYLTNLLPRRPDLKVIITSATIDSERFARHFAPRGVQSDRHSAPGGPVPDEDQSADARLAPVVEVTGRTYPVEVRYRPLAGVRKGDEKDLMTGIVEACDELMREGHGDILVFLSGEREIRDAVEALENHLGPRVRDQRHPQAVELLPLYSRLSGAEQHRVFAAHSARRIVLATNVAETSLTVPGVHYVVDPGTARISRYSKATKVQRLPIEPISQASARQRAGRAGRLADGIAIRLYTEDDFDGRPAFTEPEILRTSLASVLLHMISVGVVSSPDDVASFPFVESPDTRSIRDGLQLLTDLGAVTTGRGGKTRLTEVGRALARLPLDPRQARMIVEGAKHSVAYECAIIAAALSIQDPRERPSEKRAEAEAQHRRFSTPKSDVLAYLNLWAYLREQQRELSGSAFRRLCRSEYLNYLRVREWQDLVQQLRDSAKPLGIAIKPRRHERAGKTVDAGVDAAVDGASVGVAGIGHAKVDRATGAPQTPAPVNTAEPAFSHSWNEDAIHRSVLAGLLTQIGIQDISPPKASSFSHLRGDARASAMRKASRRAPNEFLGARGVRFAIQPGSPLAKNPPSFVMAAELVETNRLWARDVAEIDPAWAEELAGSLAKRSYSEPHWSTRQGAAVAHERVTLYGVPLVADRAVLWAKVNPAEARELFIRNALIEGEWTTHHAFFAENRRLLEEASEIEARSRTRGLVADEEALFEFYDDRIPDEVVSARHFDAWWKDARRKAPDLLTFTQELLLPEAPSFDHGAFPDAWPHGDLTLPVTYQFAPGADADGVTVHVPLAVLPRVSEDGFDWLVPGLLTELTTATIRALPKTVRRLLVPAPDVARDIVTWIGSNGPSWEERVRARGDAEPFRTAFTRAARDLRAVDIPADAWADVEERLPAHLRISFRVTESTNRSEETIEESRNLAVMQRNLETLTAQAVRSAVRSAVQAAAASARGLGAPAKGATPGPRASAAPTGAGGIYERDALTSWPADLPSGALPEVIESDIGGGTIARGYPAIVEEAGPGRATAALRVLADSALSQASHARGVRRLLLAESALQDRRITTRWTGAQALSLAASPYRSTAALVEDLQLAAVTALTTPGSPGLPRVGSPDAGTVRDADAYAKALTHVRQHLEDDVFAMVARVIATLDASRELDAAVRRSTSMSLLATLTDVRALAADLVGEGFVSRTPAARLKDLPRYLRAATHRIAKAQENPARDAELAWRVRDVSSEFERVRSSIDVTRCEPARMAELDRVRWMVEEYRVSLFAQQLGTDGPVSDKRIRSALAAFAR